MRLHHLKKPPVLLVGLCLAFGLVVAATVIATDEKGRPVTPRDYEKYYWQDTKYQGIRTRIAKRQGATYTSTIEYPVTKRPEVNQIIADAMNRFDRTFQAEIGGRLPVKGGRFSQNTSYQVVRVHGDFLSIEAVTTSDTQGATTEHDTAYWTFNLASGHEVTLSDIFGGTTSDGEARLMIYIKQDIQRQATKKGIVLDDLKVASVVNPEALQSFLTTDADTIRFDFGAGMLASEPDGPITVTIPIANLQLFLQSPKAKNLFDIMPIGQAAEWKAPVVAKGAVDCTHAKCIALTFDDGPGPLTARLLDTLKEHQAHATFFLIGQNIGRNHDLVKRMHTEGHTVGNHTWDHRSLPLLSAAQIDSEISRTNDAIQSVLGTKPSYFRPPNGAIGPAVYAGLKRQNMTGIMWSVDTRDWADRNADIVYNRVISGAKPGAIIILHDIHATSVAAVPRILATLQRQGYAFVSIEELFGPNALPGGAINRAS